MGRLTLNVLLSFAQFEREVTGERIRDKIAASKRKGLWMGGVVPLGYRVEARKLLVDEPEAVLVRRIFARYLELGSLPALQRELREEGIRTRSRQLASGKIIGDVPLTNGPLAYILKNRHYLGELNHRGKSYPGDHAAIVPVDLFEAVQRKLAENLNRRDTRRARSEALLLGRIFDDRGNRMSPSHALKKGVRYRYYVSSPVVQGRKDEAGSVKRVPAVEIEKLVIGALRDHASRRPASNEADRQGTRRDTAWPRGDPRPRDRSHPCRKSRSQQLRPIRVTLTPMIRQCRKRPQNPFASLGRRNRIAARARSSCRSRQPARFSRFAKTSA